MRDESTTGNVKYFPAHATGSSIKHKKMHLGIWRSVPLLLCVAFVLTLLLMAAHPGVIGPGVSANKKQALGTEQWVLRTVAPPPVTHGQTIANYGKLPLYFEANRGQTDRKVKFLSRGAGHTLFLTSTEAVVVLSKGGGDAGKRRRGYTATQKHGDIGTRRYGEHNLRYLKLETRNPRLGTVLRMQFVGGNPTAEISGVEELPGKANYFIGNDPKKWHTNVPTYAKVKFKDIYSGIDLVYYGNQQRLEYDLIVNPGADLDNIMLRFQGAEKVEVDPQGHLVLYIAGGAIRQQKPLVYQEIDGIRREISGRYVLKNPYQVGFQVAAYDKEMPLIIDPTLFYSTYLGGASVDEGLGIAVDASGNAYVTGITQSLNFPTTPGAFETMGFLSDAFVTKVNPTGSGLVYSTFLGRIAIDQAFAIAVDGSGNAYIAGETLAGADFPTTPGAFQTTSTGDDAFVTKLNPTGSGLVYSTLLGGNSNDRANAIAVDITGNAYVTGVTRSTDFPTTVGAFQAGLGGDFDAFVTKVNPFGSGLVYSTYLGGNAEDDGDGIALDPAGNAYVTGFTQSSNFPTTPGAFQTTSSSAFGDAFVTKVNPFATGLVYSTYLSGRGGNAIAAEAGGNAYVVGQTDSPTFPTTPGAFQTSLSGGDDAFVTKVNPTGTGLVYSTYLGGTNDDEGFGIAVDSSGNAYVTGFTDSINFPTTPGAFQTTSGGARDVFVTKINPAGSGLIYSTYLGGSGSDQGLAIAVDTLPNPNAYVTGTTDSTNFPTTPGAFQSAFGGGLFDAFVAKIANVALPAGPITARVTGGGSIDVVGGVASFSFIVERHPDGSLSGHLQYFNHASGVRVQGDTFNSLVIVGNTATFDGTCTMDGAPCTFTVNVTDNGEPGTTDTFTISINGGPPEGGTLRSGNILIRQ